MNKDAVLEWLPWIALALITLGMIAAIMGVTTTGFFLPGIYAITFGFVVAAAAAIVTVVRTRDA